MLHLSRKCKKTCFVRAILAIYIRSDQELRRPPNMHGRFRAGRRQIVPSVVLHVILSSNEPIKVLAGRSSHWHKSRESTNSASWTWAVGLQHVSSHSHEAIVDGTLPEQLRGRLTVPLIGMPFELRNDWMTS